jgi:ATP-binding cassette, subfamily B (MDR/TAP), member 1
MMISIFSLMLGALGLGQAMIDMTDQSEGLAAARRIFRAVDAAACDKHDGLSIKGERPVDNCKGNIEIKNMTFGYPSRAGIEVCKSFNVSIAAGEVVAIVGPSGSVSTIL